MSFARGSGRLGDSVFSLHLQKEILRGELEDKVAKLGTGHPEVRVLDKRLNAVAVELQRRMVG